MEQVKNFFSSPKKTAILGLVSSILLLLYNICYSPYSLIVRVQYNLNIIGLVVYFIIVCLRLYKKSGNIKVANYILIITFILQAILATIRILLIYEDYSYMVMNEISLLLGNIFITLYLINIFILKKTFINNKFFILGVVISKSFVIIKKYYIFNNLIFLFILPYFYNYYKLLRGEKENV